MYKMIYKDFSLYLEGDSFVNENNNLQYPPIHENHITYKKERFFFHVSWPGRLPGNQ